MLKYHCDSCDIVLDNTNTAQLGLVDHSALCITCHTTPPSPEDNQKTE